MDSKLIFLPLGGMGDVTKNMYVYQWQDQILLVDCGVGFPDETVIGVDLLLPDITYLLKNKSKIRGMVLTHGHEDHFGALPYILPQLSTFPIFATRLTAAFANEKLAEFGITTSQVQAVSFDQTVRLGIFNVSFVRVTHSVPDSANLIIKTPVGAIYHASDFKLDPTPSDGFPTEIEKIKQIGKEGVLCLLSDCLRIEKEGKTPSERAIEESFERELKNCPGKFIVTTYSSNVSRLNQAVRAALKNGRKVCFVGRSLTKAKDIAIKLGYMEKLDNSEVSVESLRQVPDHQLMLVVAGSQGQGNSAMVRLSSDEDKFIKIKEGDVVVFSADPIPGNEVAVNSLIDALSKKGARVVYSAVSDELHVSGHAAKEDIAEMIKMTNPRFLIPIGGAYRQMVQFKLLGQSLGWTKQQILLPENGQEIVFTENSAAFGKKILQKNIYVDEISGGEIEGIVLRDRQKLAEDGIITILIKIDASGQVFGKIDFIARGFVHDNKKLFHILEIDIKKALAKHKGRFLNTPFIRNMLSEHIEKIIFKRSGRRPLVLPIVVEV